MKAYQLLPKLKYLTLVGLDDDKDLLFMGDSRAWSLAEQDINNYENNLK